MRLGDRIREGERLDDKRLIASSGRVEDERREIRHAFFVGGGG